MWLDVEHENWDLKIFVSDNQKNKKIHRINRDVNERGYSEEEAIAHYSQIDKAYSQYIYPSLKHCSMHVRRVGKDIFEIE